MIADDANDDEKPRHECSADAYDRVVAWCRETIAAGHEMLFSPHAFHEELGIEARCLGLPRAALHSLFRNTHVSHARRAARALRSQTMRHVRSYLNGASPLALARRCNCPPSMMARLVVENVARCPSSAASLTDMTDGAHGSDGMSSSNGAARRGGGGRSSAGKQFVSEALRHPEKVLGCASAAVLPEYLFSERNGATNTCGRATGANENEDKDEDEDEDEDEDADNEHSQLLPLSRLCLEVREAVDADPICGPIQDRERHNVGIEYELLLEETLRCMDIPFETEAELRVRGTARTPDILLSCPVGLKVPRKGFQRSSNLVQVANEENTPSPQKHRVDNLDNLNAVDDEFEWKIVCWIDSKASFGDIETHTNNVLPQVETYVHRFGPGLVLYWFGHAPLSQLGDSHGDVVIVGGDVPDLFLLPTGEFRGRGGVRHELADVM